jgi:hypothetical protein
MTLEEALRDPDIYTEAQRLWREENRRTDSEGVLNRQERERAGTYNRITNEQVWKAVEIVRKKRALTPAQ